MSRSEKSVAAEHPRVGRQVQVPKAAELIARSLRGQIVRGELAVAAALPSETSLIEQFGVSRPTLREAFRVLESEGLITVRRGVRGGARVVAPDADVAARYAGLILEYRGADLADVYHASAMVEPACARGAAGSRTAADVARLREIVAREGAAFDRDDPEPLLRAQDDFHAAVVEIAGNQTLILLSGMLRFIVDRANAHHLRSAPDDPSRKAQARSAHRTHAMLVDLIEAGDAEEAGVLWARHIAAADDAVNTVGARTVLDLLD